MNRIYYASFYAAKALLILKELDTPKHSGVIALFNQHFVKEGIIARETGRILNDLFGLRIEGDYEDFKLFKREEVEEALQRCQFFVAEIEKFLKAKMAESDFPINPFEWMTAFRYNLPRYAKKDCRP